MTKQEELAIKLDEAVAATNAAILSDSYSEIGKNAAAMKEALDALNKAIREEAYETFFKDGAEGAMKRALTQGYVTQYKTKKVTDKSSGTETYEVDKTDAVIDLIEFESAYKGKGMLCHDGQWRFHVEKFAQYMALRASKEAETNQKDEITKLFSLSERAQKMETPKDPTSNASLSSMLQEIVDGIIWEGDGDKNALKVINKDIKYILMVAYRKGRGKLSISSPKTKTMHGFITEVAHRLVTDGGYTVEFDMKK